MRDPIPVVLCSDNGYAIPLYVAITSALRSKALDTVYRFYCLVSDDFSPNVMTSLDAMLTSAGCPPCSWIFMGQLFQNSNITFSRITEATFYRLLIPRMIPEPKCLYLDVDLCVCGDLSALYQTDLSDCYLAGVKDAGKWGMADRREDLKNRFSVDPADGYVNAGVLVMNLDLMRAADLSTAFLQMISADLPMMDQDILYCVCSPKIRLLPPKYNAQPWVLNEFNTGVIRAEMKNTYTDEEWEDAKSAPVIMHYADRKKAWTYPDEPHAKLWWTAFDEAYPRLIDREAAAREFLAFYLLSQRRHVAIEKEQNDKKNKTIRKQKKELEKKASSVSSLKKELEEKTDAISSLKKELKQIKNSRSLKIGLLITWLPRKVVELRKKLFRKEK